jgi:hypothetical protein
VIGKKVLNAKGGGSKAARIGGLLDYIRAPQRAGSDEKCAYYGARGFLTDSPGGHRAEMVALAQDAARSSDPVNHYILSWREGEVPLPEHVEQAVTLFLDELGLADHQVVYGLHSDTDNIHLHIAVNRVHPESLRVVKIHRGFDLEAVHRAVARIEHAQGWMPERRARYQVNERGEAVRSPREHAEPRRPAQDKCDREAHTGHRSAERTAIEEAGPIIASASSWDELHVALAERGMRYERTGSGAKVFVGDTAVKASRVTRDASLGKLERRLGPYRAAPVGLPVQSLEARPLRPELPGWQQYSEERAQHYAEKGHAWQQVRARLQQERRALREDQRRRRAEVLSGNFAGRGQLLNALRAALSEEQRAEGQAQRRDHRRARQRLGAQFPRFPGLEQWLRDRGQETVAEQWRYRECAPRTPDRPASTLEHADASTYTRFAADWQVRQDDGRDAVARAWSGYARDVARLKSASKRRWAAVRLVAKGPIAGKLWALSARLADQRAWRRLHERHRAALRAAEQDHRPLEWAAWLRGSGTADESALATPPRVSLPAARAANAVTAGGTAVPAAADKIGATEVAVHRVPGGAVRDDGQRLTLSEGSTQEAVAALLQLARARYGARLGVDGDEGFRERLVLAAVVSGLDVTFADPQLEGRRQQLQRKHIQDSARVADNPRPRSGVASIASSREQEPIRRKGRSR